MFEMIPMPLPPLALSGWHWLFILPICVLSVFLMLLILVQRGRGGGLTGALGGMGGQSAFGAKAGDLFTKITVVVAMIWILLSMGAIRALHVDKLSTNRSVPKKSTTDNKQAGEPIDGKTGTTDSAAPVAPAPGGLPPADPPATPDGDAAPSSPAPAAPAPADPTPESTSKAADEGK